MLADVSAQLSLRRLVELRSSRETDVPLSYGFLRPVVLLPAESSEWSGERRRVVLLHELIHVKRLDALFCLIGAAFLSPRIGSIRWHGWRWRGFVRSRSSRVTTPW